MTYNSIWSLVLSLMVFLIVILLCMKDKKKEISTSEYGNLEKETADRLMEHTDMKCT